MLEQKDRGFTMPLVSLSKLPALVAGAFMRRQGPVPSNRKTIMNSWLDKIRDAGFEADILFMKDGDYTVVLHWKEGSRQVKQFRDVDADRCLETAMAFVNGYDAYITNAALCSGRH